MALLLKFLILSIALLIVRVESKPFFDALYAALSGDRKHYDPYGQQRYNYNNYGYGQNRPQDSPQRKGKTWKDICRAHYPDAIASPGRAGVVPSCPY